MLHQPFYDPNKTYEENFTEGPFGAFAENQKYTIFGINVRFPFGIAAGPLLNSNYVIAALDKGFDIVVYKTVRTQKYPCNEWPNVLGISIKGNLTLQNAEKGVIGTHVFTKQLAVTNSFGVPSFEPKFWMKDLANAVAYARKGQLVIGSFQGTVNKDGNIAAYIRDFAEAAKMVKQTGVKVLEANLSCPNEGNSHLLCFDIERTTQIIKEIRKEIGKTPLIIKIAYFEDKKQLEKLIHNVGRYIDGIAAINTIPAKILNKKGEQALPGGPGRLRAGVCGKPIQWAGLKTVKELKRIRKALGLSYLIFGTGGVVQSDDYKKYKDSGADVVMSATGAIWNPYLAMEIKKKYS